MSQAPKGENKMMDEKEITKAVCDGLQFAIGRRRNYGPEGRALQAVYDGYNYTVGGWENAIADGLETEMPSFEQLREEIYDYVIEDAEEHKFWGRDNIMAAIKIVFEISGEYSTEGEN
jgi:hypothetical protein